MVITPPAAPPPPPPPPVATAPAVPVQPPPAKKEPKRWFASLQPTVLESPFKQDKGPLDQARRLAENAAQVTTLADALGGGDTDRRKEPLATANWVKPGDPTRVLYRGQPIHGQTLSAIDSTVPGEVRILVTQEVRDRITQTKVLIQQFSLLLGSQSPQAVKFGERRLSITDF